MSLLIRGAAAVFLAYAASGCLGSIGGQTSSGGIDEENTSKPLPGESSSGETGISFPRLSSAQWKNSALQLLGLPASTTVVVPEDPRLDRFIFDTNFSVAKVAESNLSQFRDVAEQLATLATQDDAAVNALLPLSTGVDLKAKMEPAVTSFLLQAFRRPPGAEEVATYTTLAAAAPGNDEPARVKAGAKRLAMAVLQSPKFLYRIELGELAKVNATPVGGRVSLSGFELATRVSLALFNVAPDAAMLAAAKEGKWDAGEPYAQQLNLMLSDPRAKEGLVRFHEQLYASERFVQITKNAGAFPTFSPQMAADMRQDMRLSIADVIDTDGGLQELLTTRTGYINARLAPVYGLSAAPLSEQIQKTELPAERAGILSRAGWLAFTAGTLERRDVIRGLYVSHNLLCESIQSPKDPPKTPAEYPANLKTNRQRMEFTTGDAVCKGCHNMMNPKGYAFERFDALGVLQSTDNGEPIDSTGSVLIDGKLVNFDGHQQLMSAIASSRQGQACYAKHWTSYLLGYDDSTFTESISKAVADEASSKHMTVRDVVRTVLKSPAFTTRKISEVAP